MRFFEVIKEAFVRFSDVTALSDGHTELTYADVDRLSNQIAHDFLLQGLSLGDVVLVSFRRDSGQSIYQVLTMIALFKLNCIYLPLDPHTEIAEQRRATLLKEVTKDCEEHQKKCYLLVFGKPYALSHEEEKIIFFDLDSIKSQSIASPLPQTSVLQQGYIVYSSGSTGTPKGMILGLDGLAYWYKVLQTKLQHSAQVPVIAGVTSWDFDPHIWEWLMALSLGACLRLSTFEQRSEITALHTFIQTENITHITLTPSNLSLLLNVADRIKTRSNCHIFSTGEACARAIFKRCENHQWILWNCYGPSEVVFGGSMKMVKSQDFLNGETAAPIAPPEEPVTYRLESIDDDHQVKQRLLIYTPFVALRYINNPSLTQETLIRSDTESLFKTDDWLQTKETEDGVMYYFLGRLSSIQKVKGVFVDLAKIDSSIESTASSQSLIAVATLLNSQHQLVSYVCDSSIQSKIEKQCLSRRIFQDLIVAGIPLIGLPERFIFLTPAHWPINQSSGKTNKQALLDKQDDFEDQLPDQPISDGWLAAECSEIKKLWSNQLGLSPDSIDQNVRFNHYGGDSRNIIPLRTGLQATFNVLPLCLPSNYLLFATLRQTAFAVKYKVSLEFLTDLNDVQLRLLEFYYRSLLVCQRNEDNSVEQKSLQKMPHKNFAESTLFYLHPVTGSIREFLDFVVMDPTLSSVTFVALISPLRNKELSDEEKQEFLRLQKLDGYKLEQLAYYISILLASLELPSYRLLGWSFGGLLAIETARFLRQQFEKKVDYIGLGDTEHPQFYKNAPDFILFVRELFGSLVILGYSLFDCHTRIETATSVITFLDQARAIIYGNQQIQILPEHLYLFEVVVGHISMIHNITEFGSSKFVGLNDRIDYYLASDRDAVNRERVVSTWRQTLSALRIIQTGSLHNTLLESHALKGALQEVSIQPFYLRQNSNIPLTAEELIHLRTWHCIEPVTDFFGRDTEIKELLASEKSILVVTGTGGLGKTQIAGRLSNEFLSKMLANSAIWLHCDRGIENEWVDLATQLKLDYQNATRIIPETIVSAVIIRLKKFGLTPCLLVMDNIIDKKEIGTYLDALSQYLKSQDIKLVITSRDTSINFPRKDAYKPLIDSFSGEDGAGYILQALGLAGTEYDNAVKLSNELGGLPLALSQAIAVLSEQEGMPSLIGYVDSFKREPVRLLQASLYDNDPHRDTFYKTTKFCVDLLRKDDGNQTSFHILEAACFLQAANIPMKLLKEYLEKISDQGDFETAMNLLYRYGLLQRGKVSENPFFRMHRLIQVIYKSTLLDQSYHAEIILRLLQVFQNIYNQCKKQHTVNSGPWYDTVKHLHPHLMGIWQIISVSTTLRNGEVVLVGKEGGLPLTLSPDIVYDILNVIAFFNMRIKDDAASSVQAYEQALRVVTIELGEKHWSVALVLNELSIAYGDLGQNDKQRELLDKALLIMSESVGTDNPKMATLYENRANLYTVSGDIQQCQQYLRRSITINETFFNPDHFSLVTTLHNLGVSLLEVGVQEAAEARRAVERSLAISEQCFGSFFPRIAITLHLLSNVFALLGDRVRQKEYIEKAYELNKVHRGESYWHTASDLYELGNYYGMQNNKDQQIEYLKQAYEIFKKYFGDDIWVTAFAKFGLDCAKVWVKCLAPEEFVTNCERYESITQQTFGVDYWRTQLVVYRKLECLRTYKFLDEAKQALFEKAESILRARFGSIDPQYWYLTYEVLSLPLMNNQSYADFAKQPISAASFFPAPKRENEKGDDTEEQLRKKVALSCVGAVNLFHPGEAL